MAQWQLGIKNGILFGVPPPQSDDEANIQKAVEQAVRESEDNGISKQGNAVTPWLLARVEELSAGTSLRKSESKFLPLISSSTGCRCNVDREQCRYW